MATAHTDPTAHTYEVVVDQLEVTRGGLFGGERDVMRQFVSGPVHYLIDGEEVDEQTWKAATAAAGLSFND